MFQFTEKIQFYIDSGTSSRVIKFIAWHLLFMRYAILTLWVIEIFINLENVKNKPLRWRSEINNMLWIHVIAKLPATLVIPASGLLALFEIAPEDLRSLFAASLLFFATLNSLSCVFTEKQGLYHPRVCRDSCEYVCFT